MRVCYVSGTVLCTLHKLFHLNSTMRLMFLWFLVFFYTSKPRFWDFTYAIPVSGSDMIQIWACQPYSSCAIHSTITDFQLQINLYQKNYEDCMEVQKKYARIKLKENCSSKKKNLPSQLAIYHYFDCYCDYFMRNHAQIKQVCIHILFACTTVKTYSLGRVLMRSYLTFLKLWFHPGNFRHGLSVLIGLVNYPFMEWMVWLILKMN